MPWRGFGGRWPRALLVSAAVLGGVYGVWVLGHWSVSPLAWSRNGFVLRWLPLLACYYAVPVDSPAVLVLGRLGPPSRSFDRSDTAWAEYVRGRRAAGWTGPPDIPSESVLVYEVVVDASVGEMAVIYYFLGGRGEVLAGFASWS